MDVKIIWNIPQWEPLYRVIGYIEVPFMTGLAVLLILFNGGQSLTMTIISHSINQNKNHQDHANALQNSHMCQ